MIVTLAPFSVALWNDGTVSRAEGLILLAVAVGLMMWLYRRSPTFRRASAEDGGPSRARALQVRRSVCLC